MFSLKGFKKEQTTQTWFLKMKREEKTPQKNQEQVKDFEGSGFTGKQQPEN